MNIRKVAKNELKKVANVFKESFAEHPFNEKWTNENAIKKIRKYNKDGEIIVAIENKKVLGFIIYRYLIWDKSPRFFIDELGVKREYRGRGIATYLIKKVEENAKKKRVNVIELVANKRSNAFQLYKRISYQGTDAVLMEKRL